MDFVRLKNLIKTNGDKFIFLDNGEPELVVMSFQEYEKLNGLSQQKYSADFSLSGKGRSEFARPSFAKQNLGGFVDFGLEEMPETELDSETEFMAPFAADSNSLPVRLEDIRLEDLPI